MSVPNHVILKHVESHDPDGGNVQPTDADYAAFRDWVLAMYGDRVWDYYIAGGWNESREV